MTLQPRNFLGTNFGLGFECTVVGSGKSFVHLRNKGSLASKSNSANTNLPVIFQVKYSNCRHLQCDLHFSINYCRICTILVAVPLLLHQKQQKCLTKQTLILKISKTWGKILIEILHSLSAEAYLFPRPHKNRRLE